MIEEVKAWKVFGKLFDKEIDAKSYRDEVIHQLAKFKEGDSVFFIYVNEYPGLGNEQRFNLASANVLQIRYNDENNSIQYVVKDPNSGGDKKIVVNDVDVFASKVKLFDNIFTRFV